MQLLQVAYWINIVVLVPIAIPTVFRLFPRDQHRFEESAGWRVLVGSLWSSIAVYRHSRIRFTLESFLR